MAYVKLKGKAKLEADLAQLKVKVTQAQDKLNAKLNGVPLIERDKAAYDAANKVFEDAITARDKAQTALNNYKEPVKTKTAAEIEADRQKTLIEGKDPNAKPEGTTDTTGTTGTTGATGNVSIEDFFKNLDGAPVAKIKEIQKLLGVPATGKLDFATIVKITKKETEIETIQSATGRSIDRLTYYTTGDSGAGGPTLGGTISSPTGAADLIESAIKTELGRTPSAAERKELTEKLNAAERKNPSKTIKGITTQGLDKEQFLREEVRKIVDPTTGKSEYENKKVQKRSVTTQSLLTTINANGLKIPQSQIDTWSTAVENGTDIKIINNEIRNIAGLGMPENVQKLLNQGTDLDAIVSPYKQVMARVLELNPNSISVNDSLLRDAIGGNYSKVTATPGMGSVSRGEYSMYEFEKALRKDYRWQFTNTAKEDVFESVNKVFKDFGLQG